MENPHRGLYTFRGYGVVTKQMSGDDKDIAYDVEAKNEKLKFNLDLLNFLHRGATIKNSGKVFVMVLYTGKESKIMMNNGKYKFKKSGVEKKLNLLVLCNIILLLSFDALMVGLN